MGQFLLECYFNECYKGRKYDVSTPRYADESRLCAMRHSAEFLQKILSPIPWHTTQHEIQYKILWSTSCYAAQRGVEILCYAHCANISAKSKPNLETF
jgi:hypothetical protein